jgi:hypothetical protein
MARRKSARLAPEPLPRRRRCRADTYDSRPKARSQLSAGAGTGDGKRVATGASLDRGPGQRGERRRLDLRARLLTACSMFALGLLVAAPAEATHGHHRDRRPPSHTHRCRPSSAPRRRGAGRAAHKRHCTSTPKRRAEGAEGQAGAGWTVTTGALKAIASLAPQPTAASPQQVEQGPTGPSPGLPGENGEGCESGYAGSTPFRLFSPSSIWNEPAPSGAAVDPASVGLVASLASTVFAEREAKAGPWINTASYSVPVYTVAKDQPTVRVTLEKASSAPALQAAWEAVPLPEDAHPAEGTDGVLVLWQPSTDRLWEFWRLSRSSDGWHAAWGGAMQHVSANAGVYGSEAWPGAQSWWGDSASSLELAGGLITLEELQCGVIDHALAIALPEIRAGVYASPAKREDGKSSDPLSLPEGARLRLNPRLNLQELHLPRVTLMIAQAAQRYGIYVRDGARNVTFFAQDPTPTGANPYIGAEGYFEGMTPAQLLAPFPWSQLEVLQMELHKSPKHHRHRRHRHRRRPRTPRRAA